MPNKVPDGRPSTGTSTPTPGTPGPAPDRPSAPTGDSGGDVRPQPSPPTPPGINLTGGDQQETAGLDAELLDIALMEDPDAGGEIATASGIRLEFVDDAEAAPADASPAAARRTEVRDAHDRVALTEDPDAGGELDRKAGGGQQEVRSDPEGGGEVAVHRAAVDDIDGEHKEDDHDDEITTWEDPDGGGAIDGHFGSGATPPRPATMTAGDLRADPDGGGELTEDPDAGGEIVARPPLDGISVDDLARTEDPDAGGEVTWGDDGDDPPPAAVDVEPTYAEPIFNATDLELSSDFDEASHTFDPE
jgi:hypothetical protein